MGQLEDLQKIARMADERGDKDTALKVMREMENMKSPINAVTDEKPAEFSAMEMVKNIPSSAWQYGKEMVQPFIHPIETGKALGTLGSSAIDLASKGLFESLPEGVQSGLTSADKWLASKGVPLKSEADIRANTGAAEQVGGLIGSRYGTPERAAQTLMKDPVGLLGDVSALVTGGGALAAKAPGLIGKIGSTTQKVGMGMEPTNLLKGVGKTGVGLLTPQGMPVGMYESAAKFPTTMPAPQRRSMAETALKHKIAPTSAGIEKLDAMTNDFNTRIGSLIDEATASGQTIPKSQVFKHLGKARESVGGVRLDAQKNLRQVNKVAKEFDIQLKRLGKTALTPRDLQDLKTDTYKKINFDAKKLKSKMGTEEARKAIAKGAKESIEVAVPDVQDLNRQLGELLELRDPLERAAGRIENRDIIGLGVPMKATAGGVAAGTPGAVAGLVSSILDTPKVKASLAIQLKQLQDLGLDSLIDHRLKPTLIKQGLLQSGRTSEGEQ
jgi:hypothetical protein